MRWFWSGGICHGRRRGWLRVLFGRLSWCRTRGLRGRVISFLPVCMFCCSLRVALSRRHIVGHSKSEYGKNRDGDKPEEDFVAHYSLDYCVDKFVCHNSFTVKSILFRRPPFDCGLLRAKIKIAHGEVPMPQRVKLRQRWRVPGQLELKDIP